MIIKRNILMKKFLITIDDLDEDVVTTNSDEETVQAQKGKNKAKNTGKKVVKKSTKLL